MTFSDFFRAFARIGLLSFGGPAAQIALMHRELVDDRKWLSEAEFLRALSFCMMLPGPEAMQLATYAGWKLRGVVGGIIAGLLFVLPGAAVIAALALLYLSFGDQPLVRAAFVGVKAAVIAIVLEALLRISKRALKGRLHYALAAAAFVALAVFHLPFPLVILVAGLIGAVTAPHAEAPSRPAPAPARALRVAAIAGALWAAPLFAAKAVGATFLTEIGIFFSKLAVVTFGGAYAVLAYMAQEVVTGRGWLTPLQMVDALGLAETTPGPLILVTQFVATLAGASQGGIPLALLAGAMTLWVTFVPCFLWIFAGAPYIDWLTGKPRLSAALSGITAAVVGVILNLSLWFALHLGFRSVGEATLGPIHLPLPDPTSADMLAILLAVLASYLLLLGHWGLGKVLALSAFLGLALGGWGGLG
ncbi:MAG: chromate efflux transporter [Marivivens sp.]